MSEIDKRIVEMQFDNRQFESGIQTSIRSLDKLNNSLEFDGAAKGFGGLEKAVNSFSLAGIADGVSTISSRFTTMGIMGVKALENVANSAYYAGKRMVKSLTIDPIKTGMAEYETQINSIQTILANTTQEMNAAGLNDAERLELVNGKLDELNEYADKTIYNFTEMTRNIGTFTAAGVDLETSVSSIRGIANLAAVSGSTSEQAARGMYQLSQAISTGTVRLVDWNSVVNAGMGGEVFQKALIDQARAMGVTVDKTVTTTTKSGKQVRKNVKMTIDELIADAGSFRESLSDGWLSSDVLTRTLENFAMDFEAIAKANDISIEEAKKSEKARLMSQGYDSKQADEIIEMAEMATAAATEVKTFTQLFDTLKESAQSGWTQTWEHIIGDFNEAKELLTSISDYFGGMISSSAEARNEIVGFWKTLGGRNLLIGGFWNIIHAVENVVNVFKDAFSEFFPPTTGKQLYDITKKFTDFTQKLKWLTEDAKVVDKLQRAFRGVAAAFDILRGSAGFIWRIFIKLLGAMEPIGMALLDFAANIGDFVVSIRGAIFNSDLFQSILTNLGKVILSIKDVVVSIGRVIGKVLTAIWEKIKSSGLLTKLGNAVNNFLAGIPDAINKLKSWGKGIVDYVKNSEVIQKAWEKLKAFFGPAISGIRKFAEKFRDAIKGFFETDTSGVVGLWEKIKLRFSTIGDTLSGVAVTIKEKAADVLQSLKDFFSRLFGGKNSEVNEAIGQNGMVINPKVDASGWLSTVQEKIKEVWEKIKQFFSGYIKTNVTPYTNDQLVVMAKSVSNVNPEFFTEMFEKVKNMDWGNILKTAAAAFAGYKVVKGISDWGKGKKEIGDAYASFGKMGDSLKNLLKNISKNGLEITKTTKHITKDSLGNNLLKIAGAIAILVGAIAVIGAMDDHTIGKGLTVLGTLAVGLVVMGALFNKLGPKDTKGILMAAAALALLVIPISVLAGMGMTNLAIGVSAIGILLALLGAFMNNSKGLGKSTGLVATAIALNMLIVPIMVLGNMDLGKLIQGGVAILALLVMLWAFTKFGQGLGKNTGLVATAIALNMLIVPIITLGNMDLGKLIQGGVAILALLAMLWAFTKFGKGLGKNTGLIATAIALNMLIVPIMVLGNMDLGKLIQGGSAIGILLAVLGAFMNYSQGLGKSTGLVAAAIALNLLIIPIQAIGNMKMGKAIQGVLGVGAILIAMGLFSKLSGGTMTKAGATLLNAVAVAGIMYVFSLSLKEISDVPWQTIMAFSTGIVAIIAAMGVAAILLGTIPLSASLKASAAIVILAAGIGAGFAILASLAGGAIKGFANSLFQVGACLESFTRMTSGTNGSSVQGTIDAIKGLADMAGYIALKDTSGFDKFTIQIRDLGTRLKMYSTSVSGLNMEGSSNAKTMVDDISAIGDKMVDMAGKGIDLNKVGASITNIGSGIELYARACKAAKEHMPEGDDVEIDSNAISGMFDQLALAAPDEALIGEVSAYAEGGGNDLTDFALGLTAIGNAIQKFGESAAQINAFHMLKALMALDMLATIQNKLPRGGDSVLSWIFGHQQTLSSFSEGVTAIGNGIFNLSNSLENYNDDTATNATKVIQDLVNIQAQLKAQKLLDFFGTGGDLSTFGAGLTSLGSGFSDYISGLKGYASQAELTASATGIIGSLVDTQGKLADEGGLFGLLTGEQSLGNFGANLNTLGTNFKTFAETVAGITVPDNMESVRLVIDQFANIAKKLNDVHAFDIGHFIWELIDDIRRFFGYDVYGNKGIDDIVVDTEKATQITDFISTMAGIAKDLNGLTAVDMTIIQRMLDGIDGLTLPDVTTLTDSVVTAILDGIALGIQNEKGTVEGEATTLSDNGAAAADDTYTNWYNTGAYLGGGLASGILSAIERVRNATSTVAGVVNSHSMDPFSNSRLNPNMLYSTQSVFNSLASNNAVYEPTIRPVLDMSNVTREMGSVNGFFGTDRTLQSSVFADTSFRRNAQNLQLNNGRVTGNDNSDVVEAINSMNERFDALSTAVSNIQLVLDTGVLVGQLDTKIDKRLGMLASRRERGI